jgi:hypothetical protein
VGCRVRETSVESAQAEGHCSFCGKPRSEVAYLIAGPAKNYICDECVRLCSEVLADERLTWNDPKPQRRRSWWRLRDR